MKKWMSKGIWKKVVVGKSIKVVFSREDVFCASK